MKTISISDETYQRLQEIATPFRGSERGTPEKTIRWLLDYYDGLIYEASEEDELSAKADAL